MNHFPEQIGQSKFIIRPLQNQLLVSHPPSALKLMRAGGIFLRVMVVKITIIVGNGRQIQVQLVQILKRYTFVLCWYKWNYVRAEIKGE